MGLQAELRPKGPITGVLDSMIPLSSNPERTVSSGGVELPPQVFQRFQSLSQLNLEREEIAEPEPNLLTSSPSHSRRERSDLGSKPLASIPSSSTFENSLF